MAERAIPLGDRCAGRAAMNCQAAVISVIILRELQHVVAHRRLSVDVAEAAVRTDIHRNPRLAFMRRAYFEAEFFPAATPYPASISGGPGFIMVHRLCRLGASGFIVIVLCLLRTDVGGSDQNGRGQKGPRGFHLILYAATEMSRNPDQL